jgi:hypothetical protein
VSRNLISRRTASLAIPAALVGAPASARVDNSDDGASSRTSTSLAMFGAVGDGVLVQPTAFGPPTIVGGTDNSTALNKFGAWARSQSLAGRGVNIVVPPGTYLFDHSKCQGFLLNIKRLRWSNYGAFWQNTYDAKLRGANFGYAAPWGFLSMPLRDANGIARSWFIEQTVVGTKTFKLVDKGDAASVRVDDWVMLGSLDVQYYGYPPNMQQYEFVHVISVDHNTGVVGIEQTIRYEHRTDFPDGEYPNAVLCGKARVWQLNTGPWIINGSKTPIVTWDIDHIYEGMNVGCTLGVPDVAHTYWTVSGRKVRTVDWVGGGFSESVAGHVYHEKPTILYPGEPDKLVESISYADVDFRNDLSYGGFGFQSPIERVTLSNSKISGGLVTGQVKNFHAINCDIDNLSVGGNLGFSNVAIIENSRIFGAKNGVTLVDGSYHGTIDGIKVSFSNGVLSILKSAFSAGVGHWNAVPGMTVNLTAAGNLFTGAAGNGVVLRIYEDSTYVYIATTLPFATLPEWNNKGIFLFRNSGAKFIRCTGSDSIRTASIAFDKGLEYWEYKQYIISGHSTTTRSFISQVYGTLVKITVTPIHTGSDPGAYISIGFDTRDSLSNFAADSGGTVIKIVVGVEGKRVITRGKFTGAHPGDAITVGGAPTPYLPANRVVNSEFVIDSGGHKTDNYQAPTVMVELQFDCGIARKVIPVNFDVSGASHPVMPTTGLLP